MNVVIVDSNDDFLKQLLDLCRGLDFQVESYHSAEQFEHALAEKPSTDWDLICLVQREPDTESYELCRSLRATGKYHNSPVLMLFADQNSESVAKAMSAGITETFSIDQMEQLTSYLRRFGDFKKKLQGTVLLVEDSISQQRLTRAILEDVGLSVETAESVEGGWKLFQDNNFDLVITDLVLIGEDTGMALINRIRRLTDEKGDVPIIVMSGCDDDARRIELYRLRINEIIAKPIVFEELIARTRYLVQNSQLVHQVHHQKLELEKKNRSLSEFIGRISHEFRNSINVELGVSKLLMKKDGFDDRQRQLIGMVKSAAEHQLCLVNDILDYLSLESGGLKVTEGSCDIRNLPEHITEMFSYKCEESELNLTFDVDESVPESVTVDETKLSQILINLMGNAVKFAPEGDVSLKVTREREKDEDWIRCAVSDTGPGIADQDKEEIFLAFSQTELGKMKGESTGLGLAICVSLAELMGGHLELASELGKGSCFSYLFPVSRSAPRLDTRPQ